MLACAGVLVSDLHPVHTYLSEILPKKTCNPSETSSDCLKCSTVAFVTALIRIVGHQRAVILAFPHANKGKCE